jgi:hypothetical protein
LPRAEPRDHIQIDGQPTSDIGDLTIGREASDFRCKVDSVSRPILVVPVGSRDPIENRPREAGELLYIEGSLVAPADFGLSGEAEFLTIVSPPRVRLDQNLLVLDPPSGVQIIDLLKNFGGYRELNDHLWSSCPESGREDIPRSSTDSSYIMQSIELQSSKKDPLDGWDIPTILGGLEETAGGLF